MKRGLVILSLLAVVAGTSSAAIQQGEREIGGLFSFSHSNYRSSSNRDVYSLDLDTAYFVTDNLSLGFDLSGDWREVSGSQKLNQYQYGIKAKYHVYTENKLVPYFGLMAGLAQVKSTTTILSTTTTLKDSGYYYGPLLGARYELNRSNDLYMEFQYKLYGGNIKNDFGLDKDSRLMIGILHQFD